MSKFKKGLTVDRDIEDPIRRPRPVSQEGYYYPEEHVNDKNSLHPNSRRQPIRQYGSSASLEVRHEHNRQQREQEFFTSPSTTPKQASSENSRNTPAMQSNFRNADSSYQQSAIQTNNYQNFGNNRRLPPQNNINSGGILRSASNPNPSNSRGINTHLIANQNSNHSNPLTPQPHLLNAPSLKHQRSPPNHYPNSAPQLSMQRPIRKDSYGSPRPHLQKSPFANASPSPSSYSMEEYQYLRVPPGHRNQQQQQQQQYHSSKNQNKAEEAPIVEDNKSQQAPIVEDNKSQRLNLSDPVTVEDYVSQAIKYHEDDQLTKSTEYLRIAAEKGSAVGKVLYGIALRHGWGCKVNAASAFNYLQQAAESAMNILNGINKTVSMSAFRGELVLAIYELGVCFRHGWGVPKSKATAAYYFEIAANMGDPDAQNDIALCYYKGEGVKKDMKMAAKYYRMADAQGHGTMGNSWIFKEKYNDKK